MKQPNAHVGLATVVTDKRTVNNNIKDKIKLKIRTHGAFNNGCSGNRDSTCHCSGDGDCIDGFGGDRRTVNNI